MVLPASLLNTLLTHQYQLSSVLLHAGTTTAEGHYFTFAKQRNGTWLLHDDDKPVKQISSHHMKRLAFGEQFGTCAYVLLYVEQNVNAENIDSLHNSAPLHTSTPSTLDCETSAICALEGVHEEQRNTTAGCAPSENDTTAHAPCVSHERGVCKTTRGAGHTIVPKAQTS